MHSNRKHALLSPSSSERWLNCTPSARLEDMHAEAGGASIHAEEGTLAHEIADLALRHHSGELSTKVFNREYNKLTKHKLFDKDTMSAVYGYVDYVKEAFAEAQQVDPLAEMLIEERFDFSHVVPNGFGTGDATIVYADVCEIIDLKFGKGIQVDATDNSQLKLYALGALEKLSFLYDIKTVKLTIVQPRLNHFSTWSITVKDLDQWANDYVRPKALAAYNGEGHQVAGQWCQFCKIKGVCRALAEKSLEVAKHDFRDPNLLSLQELVNIYESLPLLLTWSKSVASHLLNQALKGEEVEGYKVVEGRSQRKITDAKAVERLLASDYKENQYLDTKLKGVPALEKLLGAENFVRILGPYVEKPQGAPTLVPIRDPRPQINSAESAANDFKTN